MAKNITLTLGQFLLLGEAQSKILAMQGYQVNIVEDNAIITNAVSKPTNFSKAETTKPVAKQVSKQTKVAKATPKSQPKPKFGNVKKGDYFKVVVNDKDGKPQTVNCGKATKVNKTEETISASNNKLFDLNHCIAISKAEYGKLKKSLNLAKGKKEPKVSTAKRLNEKDYTVVLAHLAKKTNKDIDLVDLANGTDNSKELKEIRDQIHKDLPDLKLTAEQAVREFASLTEKVQA